MQISFKMFLFSLFKSRRGVIYLNAEAGHSKQDEMLEHFVVPRWRKTTGANRLKKKANTKVASCRFNVMRHEVKL